MQILLRCLFILGIFYSSLVRLFRRKFIIFWVFLELVLFFSVPLLLKYSLKGFYYISGQYSILQLYFLIQSVGRLLILRGFKLEYNSIFLISGLFLKLGLFPFLWWLPFMVGYLKWVNIWVFLRVKKFLSLFVLSNFFSFENIYIFLLLRVLISVPSLFFCLKNFKNLLVWRSVIDTSFVVWLFRYNWLAGILYWLFYSIILFFIRVRFFFFFKGKTKTFRYKKKVLKKRVIIVLFLILLGLPPFLVFCYKCVFFNYIIGVTKFNLTFKLICYFWVLVMFFQGLSYFKFFINSKSWIRNFFKLKFNFIFRKILFFISIVFIPLLIMLS